MAGNDSYTKLLLPFDADVNDTSIGKSVVHTPTITGAFSFSAGKFGNCAIFGGSNHVYYDTSTDFNLIASNGWTIDCWLKTSAVSGTLYNRAQFSGINVYIFINASGGITVRIESSAIDTLSGTIVVNDNNWHHIAVTGNSSSTNLFIDGVLDKQTTARSQSVGTIARVGYSVNFGTIVGSIDEFRLSQICRWTSNFTPPTSAYTVGGNTRKLINGGLISPLINGGMVR